VRSSDTEPILFVAAPDRGRAFAARVASRRPEFWCVLGHTDTCLLAGISSAGVSEELRPLTPAADAEVVLLGAPVCLPELPSNPAGAPGPSGITRAALRLAALNPHFVGAGLRVWPNAPCERAGEEPGGRIDQGRAVTDAEELFQAGVRIGREIGADDAGYLVLGESVPGGTTTALAVLLALGYAADGRVSGSMPGNAHALKTNVAHAALDAAGIAPGEGRGDPLATVSQIGDPMQPLAAGIALAASCDVLLAGGSQMVAVAALIAALAGSSALEHVAIGTTRWVVQDPSADVVGLVHEVSADLPLLAANLNFSTSRHARLRDYERFMVKEGVGAGGACIAALLATGQPIRELQFVIEAAYDELLGRLSGSDSTDRCRR
jgi:uncharacterized protein (TIGR00303 family)